MGKSGLALFFFFTILAAAAAQNPVPFVNQPLVPDAVAPGGPAFTLTVNGTGFVSGATVNWNGAPLTTTFVGGSQLTASVPASNIAIIGSASVTVVNPSPGGGASNADSFVVTSPSPSVGFRQTGFATDGGVLAVVSADFNGDGKADVAVQEAGEVQVFLGNGDGTFQTPLSFSTDTYASSVSYGAIVAADFNKDGKIDLAISNYQSSADTTNGSLSVLFGNGDGTFQPAVNYPLANFLPTTMVCADFNRDGLLDLAIVGIGETGGEAQILLGTDGGTFSQGSIYSLLSATTGVAVGDFNGDGTLDLATNLYNFYGNPILTILLGRGDGTFQIQSVSTGTPGRPIAAADFNGDGKLDLAVCYTSTFAAVSSEVFILLGNGGAGFQFSAGFGAGYQYCSQIVASDLNGDGRLDLADVGNWGVTTLIGNGDGSFQGPSQIGLYPSTITSVAAADFKGDGKVDLVTGNYAGSGISVFIQPSAVDLNPATLSFGDQVIGTPDSTATTTLTNNLTSPLTISSIALAGANAADFAQTNDCPVSPSTLAAGVSCTITVTFTHTTLGAKTAAVTISDDAAGDPQQTLQLTGTVVNPTATPSPTSLTFAGQPIDVSSASQAVTITNSGSGELTLAGITVTGDFTQTNNCGATVPQGGQCTVSVMFDPSEGGTLFGVLTISDNAADSPQSINLSGTGIAPTATLSPASLTFGNQLIATTSPPQTVTLTNNGPGPLTVASATPSGGFNVASTNCYGTVAASASCTVTVTFTPSANGAQTGTLTISDNSAEGAETVSLSGTGLGPVASLSPATLKFPDQVLGTASAPQTVTLTNSGGAKMTLSSIAATGPFSETTNCSATLSPAASCAINVTFSPGAAGAATGSINIASDAPGSSSVSLTGTGDEWTLSAVTSSATVAPGGTAAFTLSVAGASGFNQAIIFSCTGAPQNSTCAVTPASVTLDGTNPQNVSVSVATTAPSAAPPVGGGRLPDGAVKPPLRPGGWPAALWIMLLGLAAMFLVGADPRVRPVWHWGLDPEGRTHGCAPTGTAKHKPQTAMAAVGARFRLATRHLPLATAFAALLMFAMLWASCGGGGATAVHTPTGGTPAGTYTLTVTATSGSLSQSSTVTLTVQ